MYLTTTFEPDNRKAWREWLELHHAEDKEIWLIFSKTNRGPQSFSYKDALFEALCFGWIDGVRQRIDNKKYAQRFSPRTKSSKWSATNISLANELRSGGLMTPSGLAALNQARLTVMPDNTHHEQISNSQLITAIQADPIAWNNFKNLPPSHQRRYVHWISDAKLEVTRNKRITEALELLRGNKRLGLGPGEVRK